ncbi:MAG: hypothetical protein ABR568_05230 [Pyrinomonadaceae bacterium]
MRLKTVRWNDLRYSPIKDRYSAPDTFAYGAAPAERSGDSALDPPDSDTSKAVLRFARYRTSKEPNEAK